MSDAETKRQVWETVKALNRAWAADGDMTALSGYFHPEMMAVTAYFDVFARHALLYVLLDLLGRGHTGPR